ncbi:MAG: tetratricopeptide repeat protein [Kofleriaceae bacterium]
MLAIVAASPRARADSDWTVTRDPFDRRVIARYKAVLAQDPHDAGLAKLLAMYRQFRTAALLVQEYGEPAEWAGLVVIGRLHRALGDDDRALAAWRKAVALRGDDARTWLLIGELARAAGKVPGARAAYTAAFERAATPAVAIVALGALADIANARGDVTGIDEYTGWICTLDPRNARVWLARGDMMLAAGKPEIALASYTAAEKRFAGDPVRRVEMIVRRGGALVKLGRNDDAVLEYKRAIALSPTLEPELVPLIVDVYRTKRALVDLLAHYERTWRTSHTLFHLTTLAELYAETGAREQAIDTLRLAVAGAPWELSAQRTLIKLLEASGRKREAIDRLERIAREFPREPTFQLELAQRYWPSRDEAALATLARLESRKPSDTGVLVAIADLYTGWRRRDLAIAQYEKVVKTEPEYLVTIGEQYAALGDVHGIVGVSRRIAKKHDVKLLAKISHVMLDHAMWEDARSSFSEAIGFDDRDPALWTGRAAANEGLELWELAAADATQALALTGTDRRARHGARHLVVRPVTRAATRERYIDRWRLEFAEDDLDAGYLLAEYLSLRACHSDPDFIEDCNPHELQSTLEQLVERVPDDPELRSDLARAYRANNELEKAIETLATLAPMVPHRSREIDTRIAELRAQIERRMPVDDYMPRYSFQQRGDVAYAATRVGLRVGVGAGLAGGVDHAVVVGAYTTFRLEPRIGFTTRVDYVQRTLGESSIDVLAASGGLTTMLGKTRRAVLELTGGLRGEVRFAGDHTAGLAGDLGLDLIGRRQPYGIGVRLERQLVAGTGTTGLIELGIELR